MARSRGGQGHFRHKKNRSRVELQARSGTHRMGSTDLRPSRMHFYSICSPSGKNDVLQPMRKFGIDFDLHPKTIVFQNECNQTITRDHEEGKKTNAIGCPLGWKVERDGIV